MCQGFSHFSGFLHHFVLAKLSTSRIKVNCAKLTCYIQYFVNVNVVISHSFLRVMGKRGLYLVPMTSLCFYGNRRMRRSQSRDWRGISSWSTRCSSHQMADWSPARLSTSPSRCGMEKLASTYQPNVYPRIVHIYLTRWQTDCQRVFWQVRQGVGWKNWHVCIIETINSLSWHKPPLLLMCDIFSLWIKTNHLLRPFCRGHALVKNSKRPPDFRLSNRHSSTQDFIALDFLCAAVPLQSFP